MKTIRFYYSKPRCRIYLSGYVDTYTGKNQVDRKVVQLPRVCICGIYDKDTDILSFGVSRCSKVDQFVKKEARKLAEERARENPYFSMKVGDAVRVYDAFIATSRNIEKEVLTSQPINITHTRCLTNS